MHAVTPDLERTLQVACDACFGTAAVWPLVARAYGEPQRFYHTLAHLAELFAHLAPYRAEPLWPAIELAVQCAFVTCVSHCALRASLSA